MQHYPQLLELLEVPQLMEACVKGRMYERALGLQAFARQALQAHPNVQVLTKIQRDVAHWAGLMKHQLTEQLSSDCDTETTIRAVDYLRRVDPGADEVELRLRFLKARDAWMEAGAAAIPTTDATRLVVGRAERLRADLFYVVTQYHTLFGASENAAEPGANHVLWWFAFGKIRDFVALVDAKLPLLLDDGEQIAAVMDAALYSAAALSRVGLDFRVLLHPLFERAVERMLAKRLGMALHFFAESLHAHGWKMGPDLGTDPDSAASDARTPPASLLRHAPLALFANDVLDALNHLRYVALLSLYDGCVAALRASLTAANDALRAQSSRASSTAYADMCSQMTDVLIPFVTQSLQWIYSRDTVVSVEAATASTPTAAATTTAAAATATTTAAEVREVEQ